MRYLIPAIILTILASCGKPKSQRQAILYEVSVDTMSVLAEGQVITQAAFKTLSAHLQQAMAEGGVANALKFCNIKAMPLTDSLARSYGIELRRASHRPRNPANRADSMELATIQTYLGQIEANNELRPVVHASGQQISYHAPIRIPGALCLNCHGQPASDISESDLRVIQKLYPEDEATGFSVGELRGIWSIRFPAGYFDQGTR